MHGNTAEDGLQQQPVGHGYDRATAASAPAGHWCLAWQLGGARAPCSVLVDRRAFLAALLLLLGLLAASFAYLTMGSSALAPRAAVRSTSAAARRGSHNGIRIMGMNRPGAAPDHSSIIQSL